MKGSGTVIAPWTSSSGAHQTLRRRWLGNPPAGNGAKRLGFTLAEMLVASVVVTVALAGVHALLFRALDVEAVADQRWNDYDTAETAAARIAEALAATAKAPDGMESLVLENASPDGGAVICQTVPTRLRFSWKKVTPQELYELSLQTKPFAGSRDLSVSSGAQDPSASERWDQAPAVLIARNLTDIQVTDSRSSDAASAHASTSSSSAATRIATIQVAAGEQLCTRVVILPTRLDNGNDQGGGP